MPEDTSPELEDFVALIKRENDRIRELESLLEREYLETESESQMLGEKAQLLENKLVLTRRRE